jgi:hypothetical protein
MPAARKPASRTTTAPKRSTAAEPAALKRLNKSLDDSQKALAALRKDLGKDVSEGARDLYDDLGKFIKDARRDSGKLGTALRKDLEALQKRLAASGKPAARTRSTARRSTSAKRTTGGRTAAKRK